MSEPDWDNWEQQLFGNNEEDPELRGPDGEVIPDGEPDPCEPDGHDLDVVEQILRCAQKITGSVFGREATIGTVLDLYDRIIAYRLNRLAQGNNDGGSK